MSTADLPLDLTALRERTGGDESLVEELLQLLHETLPGQRADIANAVAARDCTQVSRAAHTLKGGAGSMAAGPVERASSKLEMAGRESDLAAVDAAWQSLDAAIAQLAEAVQALVVRA